MLDILEVFFFTQSPPTLQKNPKNCVVFGQMLGKYLWLTSGTISCWPMFFFYGWLLHMAVIQLFTICRGAKLWCADGGFSLLPEAELCSCPVFPSVWVAGHWSITLCLAVGVAKSATTGSASLMRMFGALKVPKQYVSSACKWTLKKWEKLHL